MLGSRAATLGAIIDGMENDSSTANSAVLAHRVTLALLIAKIADESMDDGFAARLHETITRLVEGAVVKSVGTDQAAASALQAGVIQELDATFGIAHDLLKRRNMR